MQVNYKERIKLATEKYIQKQEPKSLSSRKNKKPEQLVVNECMSWMKSQGFNMTIVESKAVYNVKAQRYLHSQAVRGMSDAVGNDAFGIGVFIEFKAKGRRSTIKEHQIDFLKHKIQTNCFAVVVDSVDLLKTYYQEWSMLRALAIHQGQKYLMDLINL